MADAEAQQKLKEVFEKYMDIARVSKEAGNNEQLIESYIRASSAATFLELIKKNRFLTVQIYSISIDHIRYYLMFSLF